MIRLIAFMILLLPFEAFAQTPTDPMRGLIWGIPAQAVREHEKAQYTGAEDDYLYYSDRIALDVDTNYDVVVEYHFTQDRLDQIRYKFLLEPDVTNAVLDHGLLAQNWLDQIFQQKSEPVFDFDHDWERRDPARWGWALVRGGASMTTQWHSAETGAQLLLSGDGKAPDMKLTLVPLPASGIVPATP